MPDQRPATAKAATPKLRDTTVEPEQPGSDERARVGAAQQRGDPQPVRAVGERHPSMKARPSTTACSQPPNWFAVIANSAACEIVSNDTANNPPTRAIAPGCEVRVKPPEQAAAQADRLHHPVGRCPEQSGAVEQAERGEECDRDPRSDILQPARDGPEVRGETDRKRHAKDDRAVPEGEEQPAPAGEARMGEAVEARQPVDRDQVVGVEAVLQPEHEHEGDEREPIAGEGGHASCPSPQAAMRRAGGTRCFARYSGVRDFGTLNTKL